VTSKISVFLVVERDVSTISKVLSDLSVGASQDIMSVFDYFVIPGGCLLAVYAVHDIGFVSEDYDVNVNIIRAVANTPAQSPTLISSPKALQSLNPFASPYPISYSPLLNWPSSPYDFNIEWRHGGTFICTSQNSRHRTRAKHSISKSDAYRYSWVENSLLYEIFIIEGKMIVVGSFKYSPFSFGKGSGLYSSVQNGEESSAKMPSPAPATTRGRRTCMADPTGQILGSNHPIDLAPYRGFALRQSA
jgi:hypothetical protein